jgi:hypothetical protein
MSGHDNVLVDTNIVIIGIGGNYQIRSLLESKTLFISIITEMELLGNNFITAREEYLIRDFISNCFLLNIDVEVKEKTIVDRDFTKLQIPNLQIVSF